MAKYQIVAYCFEHGGEQVVQANGRKEADLEFERLVDNVLFILNTNVARVVMYTGNKKQVRKATVSR